MSAISDAKTNVDLAQSAALADPSIANQQTMATALQNLVAAINATNPAPTTDPDATTAGLLGVYQDQLDAANRAITQGFESSGDAGGVKYYQVVVPGFAERTMPSTVPSSITAAVGAVTTQYSLNSANSFLRLGSSPDPNADWSSTPYANSVQLAKLVGDPSAIVTAEGIAAGSPLTSNQENSNSSTKGSGTTPFSDGFTDGSGIQQTTFPFGFAGDSNYFLGFADDTRYRGMNSSQAPQTLINNNQVANNTANRQAETLRLLTKGGWWDHSDGNRVTTTAGDKIEVIQGNYKMVVLGRQAGSTDPGTLSGNAFITDVSGGHFQEQYPSPTPCIKTIEYLQDSGGEWTLYQDNGQGNVLTKFKGRTVDMFQGPKREAYVGSATDSFDSNNQRLDPQLVAGTWAQSMYTQIGSEDKPIGWDIKAGTWFSADVVNALAYSSDNDLTPLVSAADTPTNPGDVTQKTWAMRLRTYVGSPLKAIKHIYTETYADEIETFTFAASHITTTAGASSVSISTIANTLEVIMGIKESLQLAATLTIGVSRTQVHGDNNTADLSLNVVAASDQKLAAQKKLLAGFTNNVEMVVNKIGADELSMKDATMVLGEALTYLASETMIG